MWQGCWYIPDRSWDAQSSGVEGAQQIRELIKDITRFGKIPTEWEESMISSLYKGKGVALERGNYRGLKLLDKVMKILKRVDENFLRQQMRIDDMQFGFMPRRSTTAPHSLYTSYNENSMPSARHGTWPLSNWKRHSTVYKGVLSGALLPSLALRSGWCGSYKAGMKMPEAECVLVATLMKSPVCKWVFNKALVWAPYWSEFLGRRLPDHHGSGSSLPRISYRISVVKPVWRWLGHHHWIARGTARETDPLED